MTHRIARAIVTGAVLAACRGSNPEKAAPSAVVLHPVTEEQIATVHLSAEAVARLGIETAEVASGTVTMTRTVGGEVIAPPGRTLTITAPVAGTVLGPDGNTFPEAGARIARGQAVLRLLALPADQAGVREAVDVAQARLRQAEAEATRVGRLYADRLVSQRDQERAEADLTAARAAATAARTHQAQVERGEIGDAAGLAPLRLAAPVGGVVAAVHVGPGQAVAAGTPLIELVGVDLLWVRVPVYAGDARSIARAEPAMVTPLGEGAAGAMTATPVRGPPKADPGAASIDLYYQLKAPGMRPGERVNVALVLAGGKTAATTVPLTAIVYDASGGTWVYQRLDSVSFARRRVDIDRIAAGRAVLARGPAAGTPVVTAGVAELFGTEFGPGK